MADSLTDEVELVVEHACTLRSLLSCLLVSRRFSEAAAARMQRIFGNIRSRTTCVQQDLCAALAISVAVASELPHDTQRRFGGGCYHIFDVGECVLRVMDERGDLAGLAARHESRARRSKRAKLARAQRTAAK